MSHKTMIDGVAYEISGGKTLIDGTAYSIKNGKTLVGGTAYEVEFAKPLNDCSWAEIRGVSDSGQAANYWAIGDRKAVTLNGTVGILTFSNETYYCYIIGIDHNSSREGASRIHFQFGYSALDGGTHLAFIDSKYNGYSTSSSICFSMNGYGSTNKGGWNSSRMRTNICTAFKNAMPSDLQSVLKTVSKYSDNTGGASDTASYITATTDTIFLLAEYEVMGTRKYANSAEQNYQKQYAWYANGNSKKRYRHSKTSSTAIWFLRSVRVGSGDKWSFCCVSTSGTSMYNDAENVYGFTPAFCV